MRQRQFQIFRFLLDISRPFCLVLGDLKKGDLSPSGRRQAEFVSLPVPWRLQRSDGNESSWGCRQHPSPKQTCSHSHRVARSSAGGSHTGPNEDALRIPGVRDSSSFCQLSLEHQARFTPCGSPKGYRGWTQVTRPQCPEDSVSQLPQLSSSITRRILRMPSAILAFQTNCP